MSPDQFDTIIADPRETPSLEFKSAGSADDQTLFAKVLKAMIAMSNRQDGGTIVIGISDDKTKGSVRHHEVVGMSEQEAATWDADRLADKVAKYTDPRLVFAAETIVREGKHFVVIEVNEFADAPVFVAKSIYTEDNREILLKRGALYVRGSSKPETVELSTAEEMRSLLSVALAKYMRQHLSTISAAGIRIGIDELTAHDSIMFDKELGQSDPQLLELTNEIEKRAYWKITIRTDRYIVDRLPFISLRDIISNSQVSLRGWNFPHLEYNPTSDFKYETWWGQGVEYGEIHEVWRFFRSGQFQYIGGLVEDWINFGESADGQPGKFPLWATIFRMLEIYIFASRLASTDAGGPNMFVHIEIDNINGRQLYQDNPRKTGITTYHGPVSFHYPVDLETFIDRDRLLTDPEALAAEATSELLQTFEFNVPPEGVKIWQSEIKSRR
jgi:hypothetical protein